MKKFLAATLATGAMLLAAPSVIAQYQITTLNEAVLYENFNSYRGTSITVPSTGNWTLNGFNNSFQGVGTGTGTAGGLYAYGVNNDDRSFGFLANAGTVNQNATAEFKNVSSSTITSFVLTFTGEEWRRISGSSSQITVFYGTTLAGTTTQLGSSTWAPADGASANGSLISSSIITAANTAISLANGESLFLRFAYQGGGGTREGLSFDDVTVTFNSAPEPSGNELYWTADGSSLGGAGTWNTAGSNWSSSDTSVTGEVWDSTKTATFKENAAAVTVGTVSAERGVQFSTTGYSLSGGTLTLAGAAVADNALTADTGVTATIGTALAGTAGMTKAGTGRIDLTGNNTGLSGGIALTSGTLGIGSANALGANALTLSSGTLTSADATARAIDNAITITGDVGLGVANSGDLTLSSVNLGSGARTLTVGENVSVTLSDTYGSGGITKAGSGALVFAADGTLTSIGISAGTATINSGVTVTTGSQLLSTGGTLNINGTLLSTATVGYTAPTGTIVVGSDGRVIAQGNGTPTNLLFSSNVTWEAGSEFVFRDFTLTPSVSGRTFAMNVIFESTGATMNVGAISGTGAWTVLGDLTIGQNVNFDYGTYSGVVDYQGDVRVGGTLGATAGARSFAIKTGKELLLENTGTLNIAEGQTLTVQGGVRSTATADQTSTIAGGTIDLDGAARTFDVGAGTGAAGLAVSSIINNGSLTKAGSGALTLSGANTYSGATLIESGTLALGSTGSIANSDRILVSSGATFDVSAVESFTVGASQAIGGAGTIVGNMSLAADAGLVVFNLTTPLTVTGTVSLDNTFSIASLLGADGNPFDWSSVEIGTYTLINSAGNFSNIQNFGSGNQVSIGDGRFAFFKEGSLQVEVVPEPSTYALLVLAGAGLAAYRLRRRHRR